VTLARSQPPFRKTEGAQNGPSPAKSMTADPLTPAVSDRICRHMNDDHAAAVLAYAHHYAGLPEASSARMLAVAPAATSPAATGTTSTPWRTVS
jgi:putative heme iron utilization protein